MTDKGEIMVPGHPRWYEFVTELSRARVCFGSTRQARELMARMGGIDVEESLLGLGRLGGTCDCAIEHDVTRLPMRLSA